jgi:hypothetical protein
MQPPVTRWLRICCMFDACCCHQSPRAQPTLLALAQRHNMASTIFQRRRSSTGTGTGVGVSDLDSDLALGSCFKSWHLQARKYRPFQPPEKAEN